MADTIISSDAFTYSGFVHVCPNAECHCFHNIGYTISQSGGQPEFFIYNPCAHCESGIARPASDSATITDAATDPATNA